MKKNFKKLVMLLLAVLMSPVIILGFIFSEIKGAFEAGKGLSEIFSNSMMDL